MTSSSYTPITAQLNKAEHRMGRLIEGEVVRDAITDKSQSGLVFHDTALEKSNLPITDALLAKSKGEKFDWQLTIKAPRSKVEAKLDEFLKELAKVKNTTVDALTHLGYRCQASQDGSKVYLSFPDKDLSNVFQDMLETGLTARQALHKEPDNAQQVYECISAPQPGRYL